MSDALLGRPADADPAIQNDYVTEHNLVTMWLRPVNPVEAAERWRPSQDHTAFILPFLFEGLRESGIYIEHDFRLQRIFGLVLKVHPTCTRVKPMDIVMFRPHAFDEFIDSHSETLYALHEQSVRTLLDFSGGPVNLIPQNGYVAVNPKTKETKSAGGVHLPDTAISHGPQEGTIFATSPEVDEEGRYTIGQRILFSAYSGSEVRIEGHEFMLVQSKYIVAVLEDTPESPAPEVPAVEAIDSALLPAS